MSIRGFEISKGTVGASTSNLEDNISALLINGPAVAADEEKGITSITARPT
jgi:hypothetical protein